MTAAHRYFVRQPFRRCAAVVFYCIGKKLPHPSMPQLFLKREKYEKIYDYQKQLLLF